MTRVTVHGDLRVDGNLLLRRPTNDEAAPLRYYTTEQVGRSRFKTNEGYLLIRDAPIARTGQMLYAGKEIDGITPGGDGLIFVTRDEEHVFRPETLASFEGKPITNDHPPEEVGPHNFREYAVGVVQNVRRGEGVLDDLMLADLLIWDQEAIKAVEDGKVELSNGYQADYEELAPGRARQLNIIGNHVALVDKGRCGPRCAIGDSAMAVRTTEKKPKSILQRVKDAILMRDEEELQRIEDELATKMGEGSGTETTMNPADPVSETHVHVHLSGGPKSETGGGGATSGTGDEDPPLVPGEVEEGNKDEGEQPTAYTELVKRMEALEGAVAQIADAVKRMAGEDVEHLEQHAQGDNVVEEEPDGEEETTADSDTEIAVKMKPVKDAATADSTALTAIFKDTLSRAEILAPGIKLPTFDAKAPPLRTSKMLCGLRRKALIQARAKDAALVDQVIAGGSIPAMTCDAVRAAFNAAAAMKSAQNNRAKVITNLVAADKGAGVTGKIASIADLNKFNKETLAARAGQK